MLLDGSLWIEFVHQITCCLIKTRQLISSRNGICFVYSLSKDKLRTLAPTHHILPNLEQTSPKI